MTFFNYSGTPTVTLTYFVSNVNTVTDATSGNTYDQTIHEEVTDKFTEITVTRVNNWLSIELPSTIEFPQTFQYFKLLLNGLPTGLINLNSNEIQVSLMDDDKIPTKYYASFENLSTNIGAPVTDSIYNWYHGPSFEYSGDTKAYIEFDHQVTLYPGRYTNLDLTLKGNSFANVSTTISLDTRSGFGALKNGVEINSGLKTTNTIALGVACGTLYGSYWLGMSLSNTDNMFKINKLRANVTQLKRNVSSINIFSATATSGSVNYSLVPGGMIMLRYALTYFPFEDIPLTYSNVEGTTNDTTFKIISGSATRIAKDTISARFGYQISNVDLDSTNNENIQKQKITSGNKCFGFGSSASDSTTLTFIIEGKLAELSGNFLATDFKYIVPTTNADQNQITIQFLKPEVNTECVFTLICNSASNLSNEQAFDMNVVVGNPSLVSIRRAQFSTADPYNINFTELQRGTSFKFMSYCRNYGVALSYKNLVSAQSSLLKDVTDSLTGENLVTSDLAANIYYRFAFTATQNQDTINRLLQKIQNGVNSEYGSGNAIASNNIRTSSTSSSVTTLEGYPQQDILKCMDNSAIMNFPVVENESDENTNTNSNTNTNTETDTNTNDNTKTDTETNNETNSNTSTDSDTNTDTDTNTNSLRYLQDNENTNDDDNTTPMVDPTPVVENYDNLVWMVLRQEPNNSGIIDFTKYTETLNTNASTKENLQAWLGSDVTVNGKYNLNTSVIDKVDTSGTSVNGWSMDSPNKTFSFTAVNTTNMLCYWKINVSQTSDKPVISYDDVTNCPAESVNCGQVTFIPSNTVVTTISLGTMEDGYYRCQFICPSEIPGSSVYTPFQTDPALQYTNEQQVDKTCPSGKAWNNATSQCETQVVPKPSTKAIFVNFAWSLIAIFSLFLFDF